MGKNSKRQPELQGPLLKSVDFGTNKYPQLPTTTQVDITRPRDIYSFLSLGHIATDIEQASPRQDYHNHRKNNQTQENSYDSVHVSDGYYSIASSNSSWRNSDASYILFNAFNPNPKLPSIHKGSIGEEESKDCIIEEEQSDLNAKEIVNDQPRKSLINEEDHKIRIPQTYIFAPPERIQETIKYNKNVILPKIKPKKTLNPGTSNEQDSSTETKVKQVQINPKLTEISPRLNDNNSNMNTSNHIFGVRPECLFINNRLGDRNPLLKSSKDSPSLLVPKVPPGLQDLKDYDEYPRAYWELRDGTITQPADLEADMIDRDLYRLRQISTLKLNTVEKTFQVNQDPFRRWRWKAGEPVFSPRQQQKPINVRLMRDKKAKEIPIYPQALPKPQLRVNLAPLRLANSDRTDIYQDANLSSKNGQETYNPDNPDNLVYEDISALPHFDTPRDSSLGGATPRDGVGGLTPREVVEASLESFRRMDEEMAEGEGLGKIPIHKLHQLRVKKHKLPIKTSVAKVDMDSLETYKREHRNSSTKPLCKNNSKGVGHSHKLESFREQQDEDENKKLDTNRSVNANNGHDDKTPCDEDHTDKGDVSSRKKVPAPLSTLLLKPDLTRISLYPPGDVINSWDVDTGTMGSSAANQRQGMPSPVVSESSAASKEKRNKANTTPMKAVNLEVFAERAAGDVVIKIPTGRISYQKNMPSYKLDLVNYPPSNPRQSCQRSTSAGLSDVRSATATNHTFSHTPGGSQAVQRARSSDMHGGQDPKNIPLQSSGADTGVSIRFGQQGHVIVSSSREGRQSR